VEVMNEKTIRPSVGKNKKEKKHFRKRIQVEI